MGADVVLFVHVPLLALQVLSWGKRGYGGKGKEQNMDLEIQSSPDPTTSRQFQLFFFKYLFLVVLGLHCRTWSSHCGGFSSCRVQALGTRASVVAALGLSGCGSRALEHRLSSCGTRA